MFSLKLISISNNLIKNTIINSPVFRLSSPKNGFFIHSSPIGFVANDSVSVELPEKPKKPMTPFLRYLAEHKSVVAKEYPNLKLTEVVSKCSLDWKNVHPTVKERYENEYKEENSIYSKKFLEYSAKLTDEQKELILKLSREKRKLKLKRNLKKKIRTLLKPKRPISAFMLYGLDKAKTENRNFSEVLKELKGIWGTMNESEKSPYEEKAKMAKNQYLKDLEEWETKMLQEGHSDLVRSKTLEEKRPVKRRETDKKLKNKSKTVRTPSKKNDKSSTSSNKIEE